MASDDIVLPLSRFCVLDLTRVRAGPTAVRQLADWGADVIKIERPRRPGDPADISGPRHGPDFQHLHRNKRSMTLDLKQAEGVAVLKRLAAKADVLIENYRPDVKHRLGIDYEAMRAVNSRLVYASISGFGQDGPYGKRPGFDQIAQGMGGVMSVTGLPGQGPVRAGIPIADLSAGLYTAIGILVALLGRQESGTGQWVRTSLLQAQIAMMDFQAARWLMKGELPGQAGNDHPTSIPTGVFRTSDGHMNIGAAGDEIFRRFANAIGAPSLADDPAFATGNDRSANRVELNARIEAVIETKTTDEWVEILNEAGVPCGPIYNVEEVFADPQVRHLGMAVRVDHPAIGPFETVGQPVNMSDAAFAVRRPTPDLGQHTDEVLRDFGFAEDEIKALRDNGIV